MKLTVIIKKGEKQYVALCPELNVVSQGHTIEEAIVNLKEAIELHIEVMGLPEGIGNEEVLITNVEIDNEKTSEIIR
ncbi:type II toxin-antitoxin system HicB family antitoxin [Candidatus Pacearchaeota archaeon]|nr:type II toxin-antitoxin system HicB family antitoxin [Candidatus Pacearchaeota archaeon]